MSQLASNDAQRLSQAITEARAERTTKADDLDRFLTVLLRERKNDAPIRALKTGLAKVGVEVSDETLRTWLIANDDPKKRGASPSQKVTLAAAIPMPHKPAAALTASVATLPPAARSPGPRIARDDI